MVAIICSLSPRNRQFRVMYTQHNALSDKGEGPFPLLTLDSSFNGKNQDIIFKNSKFSWRDKGNTGVFKALDADIMKEKLGNFLNVLFPKRNFQWDEQYNAFHGTDKNRYKPVDTTHYYFQIRSIGEQHRIIGL